MQLTVGTSSGIFDAVKEIAQERARKLKAIRSLLENGEDAEALDLTRELVGLSRNRSSLDQWGISGK